LHEKFTLFKTEPGEISQALLILVSIDFSDE